VTKWNPSSSQKLEGANLSTPGTSANDLIPTQSLSGPAPGTGLSLMNDQGGERLPGAPRPPPPDAERPTKPLVMAKELGRSSPLSDDGCMALARQSYITAEDYFNASHRTRLIDAMARFNSEHPKGSKYWSTAFEKRSRLFRPKTRAMTRKREASTCISLFGSADIVNVQASNGDAGSVLDARMQEALLNYRLQEDDRWYRLVVGSVQDADRQGFVIGKTQWDYEEASRYYDELHPELGAVKRIDMVPTVDRPGWSLIPIERFRFSPAADWMDVVNSSPFLTEVIPMFICDVRRYAANPRARLQYRTLTDGQLMSGGHNGEWDAIRMQRERNRVNRYERSSDPSDYAICWVHRNIVRIEGEDYIFDTVGTTLMLSNVIPLSEFDPRGYRPYVIGSNMLESHNPFNVGATTLMSGIQDEINDITNLSIDANKMATSGRMFIKRNTAIDLHALARFSPGAVVEMDNPQQDVKWDRSPEAPQGMMQEHQVLSTELDDLIGNFNQGSIANNRNLNETVGGLEMIGTAADQMTEYDLHTLCSTFFVKMLTQILDLEKRWETDAHLASIIGAKMAQGARQFWKALGTETKVIVNVGFGSTNPQKRLERITTAMTTTMQMFPMTAYQSNQAEILKEIWAAAGFADPSRFFPFLGDAGKPDPNPKVATLQQQLQTLMMKLYPGEMHNQGLIQREQVRVQGQERLQQMKMQGQIAIQQAEAQTAFEIKKMELQMAYIELQLEHEKNDVARGQLMLNREKLSNDITVQRMELDLARQTAMASANPPVLAVDAEGQAESTALNQPGSNIGAEEPFQADVASSNDYLQAGKMPPPPKPQTPPGTVLPQMPNQPMVTAPSEQQLGQPPQYQTNI
jgi:hypothetical protein